MLRLGLLALAVVGTVAVWRGLADRDFEIALDEQGQLQQAMGGVAGGLTAAVALRPHGVLALTVGAAAAAWIPARVCHWAPVATRLVAWCGDRYRARSVGWAVVAVVVVYGPWLAASGERVLPVARGLIAGTALLLIGHTAHLDQQCTR